MSQWVCTLIPGFPGDTACWGPSRTCSWAPTGSQDVLWRDGRLVRGASVCWEVPSPWPGHVGKVGNVQRWRLAWGLSLNRHVGQTPDKNQLSRTPREEGDEPCQVILSDGAYTGSVRTRVCRRDMFSIDRRVDGGGADGRTVKWTDRSRDDIHSLYGFVFM